MMRLIDTVLNGITMYRVVLYELIALIAIAGVLGWFRLLPYQPLYLGYSVALILSLSLITNWIFAKVFAAPVNPESTYITALILVLLIAPPHSFFDTDYLSLAFWASTWAIASKFILAIRSKHIFNPAAFGIAITGTLLGLAGSWWVGTPVMLPAVLIGGLLIVRKIRRFDLFVAFFAAALVGAVYAAFMRGGDIVSAFSHLFLYAPAVFFATVMLTEPATTPPNRLLRLSYGVLVGLLFSPDVHLGQFYSTPELALLAGNMFSFVVSPKHKLLLKLKEKRQLTPSAYEFSFAAAAPFLYAPGQYMEWTLPHRGADFRSVRRYFTLASSPTEGLVKLGVKFNTPGSSFKKAMLNLHEGDTIAAGQLSGDFTLAEDPARKLAFIAGGIGITPFRSMLSYLIDRKEQRDICLLYANKTLPDMAYGDILSRAERELRVRVVYSFDRVEEVAPASNVVGKIDAEIIAKHIPDYRERLFYISGPQGMVDAYSAILHSMGVHRHNVKRDFFPGFA